jgi:hypothetical protein
MCVRPSVRHVVLFVHRIAQAQCGAPSAYEAGADGTAAAADLSQKYIDRKWKFDVVLTVHRR